MKTFYWFSLTILLLLVVALIAVQSSLVQTKLVTYISTAFSEQTGHKVTVGKVDINWFDEITIDSIRLIDPQDTSLLAIEKLLVDFSIIDLVRPSRLHLDAVRITGADVRMVKTADGKLDNLSYLISLLRPSDTTKSTSLPRPISISRVKMERSRFSINDMRKDSIANGFNYYHFVIDSIHTDLSDFYQRLDTIKFSVDKLVARDGSGRLQVESLSTDFTLTYETMELANLDLNTPHSHLGDYVKFGFSNPSNMTYFIDSVAIQADFDSTFVSTRDLRHFAPALAKYEDVYSITGDFSGGVSEFNMKKFVLHFGGGSKLAGSASFDGFPEISETFIDLKLRDSRIVPEDLGIYLRPSDLKEVAKLGHVNLDGRFIGFPSDFVANANIVSQMGRVRSDLNLKLPGSPAEAYYKGDLTVQNLNLGVLTNEPEIFQKVSFSGNIEGKGLTPSSANFLLKGDVQKLGVKGYEYQNITTNARMSQSFFEGEVSIDDPNIQFALDGSLDFRNDKNNFIVNGTLDTLFLKPLFLSSEDAFINGKIKIDIHGLEIDSIVGTATLSDLFISVNDKEFFSKEILISSFKGDSIRILSIESDHIQFQASGDFDYTRLYSDVRETITEYELAFRNDSDEIERYYGSKKNGIPGPEYKVTVEAQLTDINPLFKLFVDEFYISKNTEFDASFSKNSTSTAAFYSAFDTLKTAGFTFIDNVVDINSSKTADSTSVLAMFYIAADRQLVGTRETTQNNYLEAIWSNNQIDFETNMEQVNTTNFARINGDVTFLSDKTIITVQPSDLQILDKDWMFSSNNQIVFTDEAIAVENFKIYSQSQEIEITGYISDSTNIPLRARVSNFELENLNPLLAIPLSGVATGYGSLANYGEESIIESDLKIDNFLIDGFLVGNVAGKTTWNDVSKRIQSNLVVIREGKKIIGIDGYYSPGDSLSPMNFSADFNNANLNIIEPFVRSNFSEVSGTANGRFRISGSPAYPILRGTGTLTNGAGRINYLNTYYSFNGDIFFDDNEIGVRNLDMRDEQNHQATLNGGIFHDGFRNFVLDLEGQLNNFQVLNTSSTDNSLYYGTAYVTGSINFLGAITNLNISANAITNRNTRIFIPLDETSDANVEEFISFVNFSDTTKVESTEVAEEDVEIYNIRLDFDLELTPDAYCELIFDIKSGDIIRGRGNGKLNLQIDTNGDFYMFGGLEIEEGGYNFTLYNIINKEFDIQKGSLITWSGDPYKGQMDIKANYRQNSLLAPVLTNIDSATLNSPELRRRYPTNVQMALNGELLSPAITFDVEVSGYPEQIISAAGSPYPLGAELQSFKNILKTDEQEMKRQVFSLIILRRFSPLNSFNVGTNSIGGSVSEFVSNQLSYWISQVDENLEIDIDLASLDNDAYNTFQLRLAYTFLDGRLRISRDGGVTSTTTRNEIGAIMGDWTLEYLLTPDGRLRAKMYSRTSVNSLTQGIDNQTNTKAGFSLQYIRSFNNFKDLMTDVRGKNQAPQPESPDQNTSLNKVKFRKEDESESTLINE